jgi:PAS domain S-box-containing protein
MSISAQELASPQSWQLDLLLNLAAAISQEKEPGEIYRTAAQGLVHLLSADRAAVLIFDLDDVLRFKESVGLSEEYRAAVEGHTRWRRGALDAQPIVVPDVLQDASLSACRPALAKEGIRAVAFIPLIANGGLIGKIVLYNNAPRELQPEEIRVSQWIASHVARSWALQHVEEALRESEERLLFAQRAAQVGVWDCDLRTNLTRISPEYARIHGLAPDHPPLTHEDWLTSVHPDDRERVAARLEESFEKTHVWDYEFRCVWPDGSVHWLLAKGKVFLDEWHRPVRMAGITLDITERRRAEDAVRESQQHLVSIYNTVEDIIFHLAIEPEGQFRFISVNPAFLRLTGLKQEEVVGKNANEVVPALALPMVLKNYRQAIEEKTVVRWEETSDFPTGRMTGLVSVAPVFDNTGTCTHLVGSVRDITEIKRAREIEGQLASDLAVSRDEIRALAASLMKAQEDERRRISRELHDQICHQLAFLARDISELAIGPLPSQDMRAQLEALRTRAVETSRETHDIAYKMHTTVLDDLGLVISLRDLCSQFSERHPNISWFFEDSGPPASISPEVATCLYRVAQEGLQNEAKHSRAKLVAVRLGFNNGAVVLTIQDDGVGFDRKAVKGRGGLGLISMEERALSVNGKLTITSQPGHGTQISLEVPLQGGNP